MASFLLLEDFFRNADPRFVEELQQAEDGRALTGFAKRWLSDPRPWARSTLQTFVLGAAKAQDKRSLIKALFKGAEASRDDALMAHFMVGFDQFPLREGEDELETTRQFPARAPLHRGRREWDGADEGVYSVRTIRYLQRRTWRYFRKLGYREPARYRAAMELALPLYTEESLSTVPRFLDSWGLVHALFGGSTVLDRNPRGADVRAGEAFSKLAPAPAFPDVWKTDAFRSLLDLFRSARSNTVRRWASVLIRRDYVADLKNVSIELVRQLLRSKNDEAQLLGVELLSKAEGLASLPIGEWLSFLELENPEVVPKVVELIKRHVSPDRLELSQCIGLALSKIAPVAELGLAWARAKPLTGDVVAERLSLAQARTPAVRAEATTWLVQLLNLGEGAGLVLHARELLDSGFADVRAACLGLMQKDERFGRSTILWTAMSESPWPDVRDALVPLLERNESAFSLDQLRTVWATTLLAIHRGGRAKQRAVTQLAVRLAARPSETTELLPLLAHSLRSVRAPERRAALAAVARACFTAPALREDVTRAIPELRFLGEEVAS